MGHIQGKDDEAQVHSALRRSSLRCSSGQSEYFTGSDEKCPRVQEAANLSTSTGGRDGDTETRGRSS